MTKEIMQKAYNWFKQMKIDNDRGKQVNHGDVYEYYLLCDCYIDGLRDAGVITSEDKTKLNTLCIAINSRPKGYLHKGEYIESLKQYNGFTDEEAEFCWKAYKEK